MGRVCALMLFGVAWAGCQPAGGGMGQCRVDGDCPLHQLCGRSAACVTGCLTDENCPVTQICGAHGRCAVPDDAAVRLDFAHGASDLAIAPDLSVSGDDGGSDDGGSSDGGSDAGSRDAALALDGARSVCGNGVVEPGESCDRGAANSDDPAATASCTTGCRVRASCGDLNNSDNALIDPATGHCYVAWPGPEPWARAQRACQAHGGALVAITSAAEDALVRTVAAGALRWIGLYEPVGGPPTKWVTGEPFAYSGFRAGQPDRAGGVEECVRLDPASGWDDTRCGFPATGNLPPSGANSAGWVCESACGNGAVDPGEECDPPGPACTATCHAVRACGEAGAASSPVNGHCYFAAGPASDYNTALAACPSGTHLATLDGLDEHEAAMRAITTDSYIALRASSAVGVFAWDNGEPFDSRRFHAFVDPEPNHNAVPACGRITLNGWQDQACNYTFVHLCERE